VILARSNGEAIIMEAIDQKQEDSIDRISDKRNYYLYGDIDITKKEDVDFIRNHRIIQQDHLGMVYTNFNYDAGNFKQSMIFNGVEYEPRNLWGPCTDAIEWFKFNHCLLGKPAKIVIRNAKYGELQLL